MLLYFQAFQDEDTVLGVFHKEYFYLMCSEYLCSYHFGECNSGQVL